MRGARETASRKTAQSATVETSKYLESLEDLEWTGSLLWVFPQVGWVDSRRFMFSPGIPEHFENHWRLPMFTIQKHSPRKGGWLVDFWRPGFWKYGVPKTEFWQSCGAPQMVYHPRGLVISSLSTWSSPQKKINGFWACFSSRFFVGWNSEIPSLKLTVRTWKWMLGILVSFSGLPIFRCYVSFRDCNSTYGGLKR